MAGGMNFQANVTTIVMVRMVCGCRLGWLDALALDVPVQVLAETAGSGDDLQLRFREGAVAEAQARRRPVSRIGCCYAVDSMNAQATKTRLPRAY
jgi:hypothetical protein